MGPIILPDIKYTIDEIKCRRDEVRRGLISNSQNINNGKISVMSDKDLKFMFDLYDTYFLNDYFKKHYKGIINFRLSRRMTRNAGKIAMPRNISELSPEEENYEIVIGIEFFFKYYQLNRAKIVNGLVTKDSLEAFQLVFEHELCHLIEAHHFKATNCRGNRFKNLALNIFGHTDSCHQLPTSGEIARDKYGFQIGDRVTFHNEGQAFKGTITGINKRATVMVSNATGDYRDKKGNRYAKWYVPLGMLKK